MNSVSLREVQELMKKYYFKRDKERGVYATFTWLVEEIGELAEAVLSGNKQSMEEESADVLAWLVSLDNLVGVDLDSAFKRKYINSAPP